MAITINNVKIRFHAAEKVKSCFIQRKRQPENRERLWTAAATLFGDAGLSGVGVDALTAAAGLTHGSLPAGSAPRNVAAEAFKSHSE